MNALIVRGGAAVARRYEVTQEMSIGRANAAIMLNDPEVSRRHAVVRPVDQGIEVEDLGSTNGTWINGRRITEPAVARNGDVLRTGQTEFDVVVEAPVAETAAPRPSPAEPTAIPAPPVATEAAPRPEVAPPAQPHPTPAASGPGVEAGPGPAPPPQTPFNTAGFGPPPPAVRRGPATRSVVPIVLAFGAIGITAVLLLLYFGLRG